jgi:membrane fusion protein (multidrug efflux system)
LSGNNSIWRGKMESKTVRTTTKGKMAAGLLAIILIVFLYLGISWLINRFVYVVTENAMVTGDMITASSRIAGKIASIKVKAGDKVNKGDILFTLDTDQLKAQVNRAEAALEIAKARLNKAVGGARSQEVTAAQSAVDQANAAYNGALSNSDSLRKTLAATWNTYSMLVKQMQSYKDPKTNYMDIGYAMRQLNRKYVKKAISDVQYTIQAQGIQQAFMSKSQLSTQITQMTGQLKALNASIAASKAGLSGAISRLKLITEGASTRDIAILVNTVKVAQASCDLAKLSLEYTNVRATSSGTVVQVTAHEGDVIVPSRPAVALMDLTKLKVTAYVPEDTIQRLKNGESVKLNLEAFPGKTFKGTVGNVGLATISVLSSIENSSTKYNKIGRRIPITIDFTYAGSPIIPGMSAEARIRIAK